MTRSDRIASIILLAFFSGALYLALSFPEKSGYFPIFVCASGIILSSILLILSFVKKEESDKDEKLSQEAIKLVLFILIAIVIYALCIQSIGFSVSTFAFMAICSFRLYPDKIDKNNLKPVVIIMCTSLIVTALIFIVFKQILFVPLPKGFLI